MISILVLVQLLLTYHHGNVLSVPTTKTKWTFCTSYSTWNKAFCLCKYYGMELFVMSNEDIYQSFMKVRNIVSPSSATEDQWIGLYNTGSLKPRKSMITWDIGKYVYNWTDGQTVSWTKWSRWEPNHETMDRCVRLENTDWKTINCNAKYSFICQQNLGSCTMEATTSNIKKDPDETKQLSHEACVKLCQQETAATEQCFAVRFICPHTCMIYRSSDVLDFVRSNDGYDTTKPSFNNVTYNKICYEGSINKFVNDFTDTYTDPKLSCEAGVLPITALSSSIVEASYSKPGSPVIYPDNYCLASLETPSKNLESALMILETVSGLMMTPSLIQSESSKILNPSTKLSSLTHTDVDSSKFEELVSFNEDLLSSSSALTDFVLSNEVVSTKTTSQGLIHIATSTTPFLDKIYSSISRIPKPVISSSSLLVETIASTPATTNNAAAGIVEPSHICGCPCLFKAGFRTKTRDESIAKMVKTLILLKNSTGSARRKLRSVADTRTSATVVGVAGVVILGITAGLILFLDLTSSVKYIHGKRSQNAITKYN